MTSLTRAPRRTAAGGAIALLAAASLAVVASRATAGPSSAPPVPRTLGAYVRFQDARINQQNPGKAIATRYVQWDRRSSATLSAAYGGVGATVQRYTDQGLSNMLLLTEARGPSPRVWEPYIDAKYLKEVRPDYEVRPFGDVWCAIFNEATFAPARPKPASVHVLDCRRSGPKLTVDILNVSGDGVAHDPAAVARMVDQAFAQAS